MKKTEAYKKTDKYIGKEIGNFLVVSVCDEKSNDGHKLYNVVCLKCGHEMKRQRISELKRKNNGDKCNHVNRHTRWASPLLRGVYKDMIDRCYSLKNKSFKYYGGKGIYVCDEWRCNPQSFNDWAIKSGYRKGLTIDRLYGDKNYCPENCHWITKKENAKWKENTNIILAYGVVDSGRGWARRLWFGVNYINKYIRRHGMDATEEMIRRVISESPDLRREYLC